MKGLRITITCTCSVHGEQDIVDVSLSNHAKVKHVMLGCGCYWRIGKSGKPRFERREPKKQFTRP